MNLEFDRPISLARSTARFTRWGEDPVNVVRGGVYHRVVRIGDEPSPYRLRQIAPATLELDGPPHVEADARWRLAEQLSFAPVADLVVSSPKVAELVDGLPGYRPPMEPDPFEALVQAVTAQQVNLQWATTTRRRLVEAFSEPVAAFGMKLCPFPLPEVIASQTPAALRKLQFTWRKSEYIIGIAGAAVRGDLHGLREESNTAVIERVSKLRGIGRWSADWLLARCLARPDVVAAGDLGVRKAVSYHWLGLADLADERTVRETADAWGAAANWVAHLLLERLSHPAA